MVLIAEIVMKAIITIIVGGGVKIKEKGHELYGKYQCADGITYEHICDSIMLL